MNRRVKRMDVQEATEDLRCRTLSHFSRPLDRMIYLASLRDYNSGLYYHDGLAARFSEETACEALADCHREAFRDLLSCSLKEIVRQMEGYIEATRSNPADFLVAWKELEPYRVAIPVGTELISAELLLSNLKIALAILESRLPIHPRAPQGAWPQPSPAQ